MEPRVRAVACTACAALVLCLAAWGSRAPESKRPTSIAAAMLWEGDPLHHELQNPPQRPSFADLHYEPRPFISLAAANRTNATLPRKLSAGEERDELRNYFDHQQAEEAKRLKPAEEGVKQLVASEHVEMTSEQARQAAADLPKYLAWVNGQYQENLKSQQDAVAKYRSENDPLLEYNAGVRAENDARRPDNVRVGQDGVVHGIPQHKERLSAKPGGEASLKQADEQKQADEENGSAAAYFDRIERQNKEAERIKRAARERMARKIRQEKEQDWARIDREVRDAPGAARTRIDSLRLIRPAQASHAGMRCAMKLHMSAW